MHQIPSLFATPPGLRVRGLLNAPLNEVKTCAVSFHVSFKYRFRMCHNNARESVLVSK